MDTWPPIAVRAEELRRLSLTPEDAYLLSRLEGAPSLSALQQLTGLPEGRVIEGLIRLEKMGAIRAPAGRVSEPPPQVPVLTPSEHAALSALDLGFESSEPLDSANVSQPFETSEVEPLETPEPSEPESEQAPTPIVKETEAAEAKAGRALFALRFEPMSPEERTLYASTAVEPELTALCFDPVASVIKAVLENPHVGLAHARIVARHHRTAQGLETLTARGQFRADHEVRHWLLRNPQLPVPMYRRLYTARRMLEQFHIGVDRDIPERTRRCARETLRARFCTGPSEEKVDLILQTEGRSLAALQGLPVDGRTASMLCARSYGSVMLIQNIARWSAAPPPLINHLLKQPLVQRQPALRALLKRHPNARK